ncbi:hypothetical protein U0070_024480 [Myodes glareolus]|uniref:GON domain-containing protein n=1 Tax=Myodes glareolus TaxID=447135 RepID=A0AAW0ISU4_MYOGA
MVQCSVTCGKGYRQRLVSCSEIYTGKENYEYSYQTTVNCPGTQPPSVHPCYLRDCPVSATWRVGNWGSCSVSCGVGVMHRSVQCLTNEDQPSHLCPSDLKPEERKTCHNVYNCELPQNCKEVKRLNSASVDGEYFLIVRGKPLKVFCAGMHSDYPKEYVTLAHGDSENFSEVYGHRLHNPTECPYNGSRRDDCHCRKDYTAAGFSTFQKIRIDLTSMQIITEFAVESVGPAAVPGRAERFNHKPTRPTATLCGPSAACCVASRAIAELRGTAAGPAKKQLRLNATDLEFARTSEGHPVPFATAGDCYSAAKCPQVCPQAFPIPNVYGTCKPFNQKIPENEEEDLLLPSNVSPC